MRWAVAHRSQFTDWAGGGAKAVAESGSAILLFTILLHQSILPV